MGAGRPCAGQRDSRAKPTSGVTVTEIMLDWWADVLARYGVADPLGKLPPRLYAQRSVVKFVRATAGATPAAQFGPLALQDVRKQMVAEVG